MDILAHRAFGLLWTAWWRLSYYPSRNSGSRGRRFEGEADSNRTQRAFPWIDLLRVRETWGLVTAKFLSDAAWYFYLFWLPKYLYDARGFDIKAVGLFAWIPYAAAGVGCLVGGGSRAIWCVGISRWEWPGRWLWVRADCDAVRRPCAARYRVLGYRLFSVAYFGQQSWSTLVMVLPTDLFPQSMVGSVAGLVGFGGAMGGIVFGQLRRLSTRSRFRLRGVSRWLGRFISSRSLSFSSPYPSFAFAS